MTKDRRSLVLPNKKQKVKLNRIRLETIMIVFNFFLGSDLFCILTVGLEGYCYTLSLSVTTYTHTLDRTPLYEGSAIRRDIYVTTHNNHMKQTATPPAGFEPAISASQRRPKAARPTGLPSLWSCNYVFMVLTRLSLILRRCVSLLCPVELTSPK